MQNLGGKTRCIVVYVKVVNYKPLITSHHAPFTTLPFILVGMIKKVVPADRYSSEDFEGQRNAVKTR